jgi:predicted RNA-binding Zn ribbon-like protein
MSEYKFDMSAGALCLNFSNTVGSHASEQPNERLNDYGDLVIWARQAGLLSERKAQELRREASSRANEAKEILQRGRSLREAIYRMFSSAVAGKEVEKWTLEALNASLPDALAQLEITKREKSFGWNWKQQERALDSMLWPVVHSAAELLISENLGRVRECASETCGWLFLDKSKNQSRRWCDMKSCGNAAKARRFYYQHKKTRE